MYKSIDNKKFGRHKILFAYISFKKVYDYTLFTIELKANIKWDNPGFSIKFRMWRLGLYLSFRDDRRWCYTCNKLENSYCPQVCQEG